MTIEQGKVEIGRILREQVEQQGGEINRVLWTDDGTSETPATNYTLQVYAASGAIYDQQFTPDHLTKLDSDNQMKMQVYQKVVGMVARLSRRE